MLEYTCLYDAMITRSFIRHVYDAFIFYPLIKYIDLYIYIYPSSLLPCNYLIPTTQMLIFPIRYKIFDGVNNNKPLRFDSDAGHRNENCRR